MSQLYNFIIIDDDDLNNKICRKIIEKTYPEAAITDFTDPVKGLLYISERYSDIASDQVVVLLDINMPEMDAWAFLERFDKLNDLVKTQVKVCILSSSVDKDDMTRANSNKHVEYYLIKPLTKESIRLIISVLNRRY